MAAGSTSWARLAYLLARLNENEVVATKKVRRGFCKRDYRDFLAKCVF